ncbi:hypothetical protein FY557_05700 [Chryseobacterium sp. SN22]|uniref:hypothetical protein n=1 Tax=Chryseobacterium sp. SN22 TaxID=2606431 RepID=UPI0011ECD0D7|nr:hypothetical protein [Chryseobacterium sp. SN22]KAA0129392.1 hypothetical protein FY557_05700 [Chryseobacterium sp. SN22]
MERFVFGFLQITIEIFYGLPDFSDDDVAPAPLSRWNGFKSGSTKISDLTHRLFILQREFANLFKVLNFYVLIQFEHFTLINSINIFVRSYG